MKTAAVWMALTIGFGANAMTIKESAIAGKTDQVTIADTTVNGVKESILADNKGFSLYTFDLDKPGKSNCTGSCLKEWPPQHVPAGAKVQAPFASIKGNDGQPQLTLNGMPLYHYDDDKKPGDAFGHYPQWEEIVVQK